MIAHEKVADASRYEPDVRSMVTAPVFDTAELDDDEMESALDWKVPTMERVKLINPERVEPVEPPTDVVAD